MTSLKKILFVTIALLAVAFPASAQTVNDYVIGRVTRVISEEQTIVAGTEAEALVQELNIELLDGLNKGKTITIQNDCIKLKEGDKVFLSHTQEDGKDSYYVKERDRRSL